MTATPHDALFKAAFSKLRHARGLLRSLVPEPLGRRIAWSTLRLESGIAVDDEGLDEAAPSISSTPARSGQEGMLVYVLAEHQSKVDGWMAFRLLCYLVAIWKGYRAQHPRAKKLPAILPIVVHHSPTGWIAPVAFEDMLDVDAEAPRRARVKYVPRFRFLLDDLSVQGDAAACGRGAEMSGRRESGRALAEARPGPGGSAGSASFHAGRGERRRHGMCWPSLLRYILETTPAEPATVRELLVRQVGRKEAEKMLTAARTGSGARERN